MRERLHRDANGMIARILAENMPGEAVVKALQGHKFSGKIYLLAVGKAAWTMAKAASDFLGDRVCGGVVITKYGHAPGELPHLEIFEAGHPVADDNTVLATARAVELAEGLGAGDELLFLISGGGSALFERPLPGLGLEDVVDLTRQLLASGADIVEMNTIRKRLSSVKAGRLAALCLPANVFAVVLSDVLGDRLDAIASGPAAPDQSTVEDAQKIVEKYQLRLSDLQKKYLSAETPKEVTNVETVITGSVRSLCESAARAARDMGYTPYILTTTLATEAREAGKFLASIATEAGCAVSAFARPCAIIAGGETVVTLKGGGKGGRNQELALAAAQGIANVENTLVFSLGSDGTDGPTDAAGGIVDGQTATQLREQGFDLDKLLADNDSYHGLRAVDGLIVTGPTGTNVNDVAIALCL